MKRNAVKFFFCLAIGAAGTVNAEQVPSPAASLRGSLSGLTLEENFTSAYTPAQKPAQEPADDEVIGIYDVIGLNEPDACAAEAEKEEAEPYYMLPADTTEVACSAGVPEEPQVEYRDALNEAYLEFRDYMACLESEQEYVEPLPEVPIVVNKNVESFITYFQTSGRKYFEKWLGRSENYMVTLRSILREHGMPEDLSYIALIESGLSPTAKSKANAVGMWQFIKGTAQRYGLRVDWWIDERMDPEKATNAAAKYFKNLYAQFGSWYLAAAGYNAGEGKVARAVKSHGTDDFWVLASQKKPFRRETKDYVPKYLAAMLIAKDPTSYGFEELEYNMDGLPYDKVRVSQATDLRVIAQAAGTTLDEIKALNPELLRWFTPPNYPDYHIKLPKGTADTFTENMAKLPPAKRIEFRKHKVRPGDTVSKIAKKYGTGASPILYLNKISNSRYLKPGTLIIVPIRAEKKSNKHSKGSEIAEVRTFMELQS